VSVVANEGKGMSKAHVAHLDGWRGIAIALVLVGHFFDAEKGWRVASAGVEVFFVLSGRLMAEILIRDKMPLPDFVIRRFARIFPMLAVYLLFVGSMSVFAFDRAWQSFLACAALVYNYVFVMGFANMHLDHIWSLCVEFHSYLLLALLVWLTRSHPERLKTVVLGVSALCMINGVMEFVVFKDLGRQAIFWRTDVRAASVLLPVALYAFGFHHVAMRGVLVCLLFVMGVLVCGGPWVVASTLGTVLLSMAILQVDTVALLTRLLANGFLTWLGRCSFSVYMWQQVVYKSMSDGPYSEWFLNGELNSNVVRFMMMVLAVLIGYLCFRCFELPVRLKVNKRISEYLRHGRSLGTPAGAHAH
jgi:peptidoglycan/LPS O-acetylase OafA/YrhL